MDAFIARQPIFDTRIKLFAYELLFRDSLSNYMPDVDGDVATSKFLSSFYLTIGIDKITGGIFRRLRMGECNNRLKRKTFIPPQYTCFG